MIAHIPGDPATEETPQVCTLCDYVITPKLIHKHIYVYTTDERTHSGVCACGAVEETAGHTWDMQSGKCEICHMEVPPKPRQMLFGRIPLPNIEENPDVWFIVSVSLASVMLMMAILLLFISIRRSLKIKAAQLLEAELAEEYEEDESFNGPEPEADVPIPPGEGMPLLGEGPEEEPEEEPEKELVGAL